MAKTFFNSAIFNRFLTKKIIDLQSIIRKLIRKYQAFNQDFQRSKELFLKWFIPEIKKRFLGVKRINYKDIPIIINNYNRLEMLTKLIHGLENKGYHNLYIIDNQSTYPPLL